MVRKLFVLSGCHHCRKTLMPVELNNLRMREKDRVEIIDCFEWENFRILSHPIMNKLKFDGYPSLFIDGIKVNNPLCKSQLSAFLDGFTENDKIIGDNPTKWKLNLHKEEEE